MAHADGHRAQILKLFYDSLGIGVAYFADGAGLDVGLDRRGVLRGELFADDALMPW
jgi:hypothetical protein